MSKKITVHSQEELDKTLYTVKPGYLNPATGEIVLPEVENSSDKEVIIRIAFGTKKDPAYVSDGTKRIEVINDSYVVAHDRYSISAYDNSTIVAHGHCYIQAYGKSTVILLETSTCEAHNSSKVKAYGKSHVDALDHSSVEVYEGASMIYYDMLGIPAYGY